MSNAPTPRQLDTLRAIAAYQTEHNGRSPTEAELGKILGVTASSARNFVTALKLKGYVTAPPLEARGLKLTEAGKPWLAEQDEPAKCDSCGWVGKTALPLESLPPQGTCPKCGGSAVGTEYGEYTEAPSRD